MAHLHLQRIGGRQLGCQLQLAQVYHLQHRGVRADFFAIVDPLARHLACNRAAQDRVTQVLFQHIGRCQRGLVVGLGGLPLRLGGLQRSGRYKAFVHQRAVVVILALLNVALGAGCIGLLLRLCQPRLAFGAVYARHHLARLHRIPFAQGQLLDFSGNACLDGRRVHGLHGAADGQGQRQCMLLHHDHIAVRQLVDGLGLGLFGRRQGVFTLLLRAQTAPNSAGQQ